MALLRTSLIGSLLAFVGRLRFPLLFALTAGLFVLDVIVPDVIPFADEVLLGLAAIVLSRWRRDRDEENGDDDVQSIA